MRPVEQKLSMSVCNSYLTANFSNNVKTPTEIMSNPDYISPHIYWTAAYRLSAAPNSSDVWVKFIYTQANQYM